MCAEAATLRPCIAGTQRIKAFAQTCELTVYIPWLWLIASWLWSAECVQGAVKVLVERSAQPSLSWMGSYNASEMRAPALNLSKRAAFQLSLGRVR